RSSSAASLTFPPFPTRRSSDLAARSTAQKKENSSTPLLLGDSDAMNTLRHRIERVAASDNPVLVTGEAGSGKELVASLVHQQSSRHRGPLITVSCAALPTDQLESEIFGHEKGAFAGAQANHRGLAESAHGGTLFLEDIDALPLEAQTRLLRLLADQEIRRVGSVEPRKVDVRVLAASQRDLPRLIREGRLREDLYFRLNVLELKVPPLRDRQDDILPLAQHLLDGLCQRLGLESKTFSDE